MGVKKLHNIKVLTIVIGESAYPIAYACLCKFRPVPGKTSSSLGSDFKVSSRSQARLQ